MDGRPHPPEYAPHTWSGFSTGKWQGNMLVVTTTHLKGAYLRRNGASFSDKATMMEYITRHGDYLLVTMIVTDPVWLEEPFIQTTNYELDPHTQLSYYPCTVSEENISTAVPHFLPGQNPNLGADDIPPVGARGGAESTYPEFRLKLKAGTAGASLTAGVAAKIAATPRATPARPQRRRDQRAAGAGQHLHAGRRGGEHHGFDRARRHPAGGFGHDGDEHEGDVEGAGTGHRDHVVAAAESLRRTALPGNSLWLDQSVDECDYQLAGAAEADPLHPEHQRGSRIIPAAMRNWRNFRRMRRSSA